MSDNYLIWSVEHNGWWGPGRCGYFRELSKAGRYSHAEALAICIRSIPGTSTRLGALPELPVLEADVLAMVEACDEQFGNRPERWR